MPQEEVEDHLTGVDIAADRSDYPRTEVLLATWPGVPAADDLHQNHLGTVLAIGVFLYLHIRPIVRVLVLELALVRRLATAIVTAKMVNSRGSRQDFTATAARSEQTDVTTAERNERILRPVDNHDRDRQLRCLVLEGL